jgi:very-short-patch-repair endonuclease
VGRTPRIPPELAKRPFSLDDALRAGLTKSALRGKSWRRLGAELYCWTGLNPDPWMILSAWQRQLPSDAVFAGTTAAWIFGIDLDPLTPIELIVPPESGVRSRPGLDVRRCDIPRCDVVKVRGLATTTVHRTLFDLCLRLPSVEALVVIDAAVRARLTDVGALGRYAELRGGRAGARRLRSLALLAEPAESPMETRLRWLLLQAGLPHPEVQFDLRDSEGRFVGRADIYYPASRVVIEYDGINHRERMVEDNRRQNLILNAGFRMLRFSAADIKDQPDILAARVRSALMSDYASLTPTKRNTRARSAPLDLTRRNWSRFIPARARRLVSGKGRLAVGGSA